MTPAEWELRFTAAMQWLERIRSGSMTHAEWSRMMADSSDHLNAIIQFARHYYRRNAELAEHVALLQGQLEEKETDRLKPRDVRSAIQDLATIADELSQVIEAQKPITGSTPLDPQSFVEGRSVLDKVKHALTRREKKS